MSKRAKQLIGYTAILVFLMMCSFICAARHSFAQEKEAGEYEVKTAFIYNFMKFVEWENNMPGDSMTVCVLGEDPFGGALGAVEGKMVKGKKFTVKRVKDARETSCHALFISSSEKERVVQIVKLLEGSYVLTIGDTEGFGDKGVMINFITKENKVRFEVNLKTAHRAGLKISSKLLSLATIVHGQQQ